MLDKKKNKKQKRHIVAIVIIALQLSVIILSSISQETNAPLHGALGFFVKIKKFANLETKNMFFAQQTKNKCAAHVVKYARALRYARAS